MLDNSGTKVVLITGGCQGIGRIVTERLAGEGYRVSVLEKDKEAIQEWEQAGVPASVRLYGGDVSREKDVKRWIADTITDLGKPVHLINNAGIALNKPIQKLKLSEWKKVLDVNLTGAFLAVKHALPHLQSQRGSVVNLSSTRALMSEANTEAYSASKGGILALTHALAISLGPQVRVNAISPGWIDVSTVQKSSDTLPTPLSPQDHDQHPAGRVGHGNDIANLILFLLQKQNDFITGQNFIIDGGMTRKMIYV
ncbi:glucose 1-dehydrogenase [Rhabdobacter roseus]|uniref:NAD(P)-dependent dehydrogenase (Short-subunit alcohol dehydrogenase family) n=1 Tax=Rhabdobacter roseus TaxID=1655419 RepID=A0A840TIR6_9BACT|nr:SDR family oxidoreductase [Rhabdobacter roseus]MBB5283344.1 NAD(P)-dependent dehydrogenase (short-subunit alcohol dehydrogenase family) [Rhabdobacter roseus]